MKHFLQNGYEVYSSVSDNSEYDLIVSKNSRILRVEVKSTSSERNGAWVVQLKKVRSNKTTNRIVNFDNSKIDLLCVYIEPEDRVLVFKAEDVTQHTTMTIKKI